MSKDDLVAVISAIASPLLGFFGILAQQVYSRRKTRREAPEMQRQRAAAEAVREQDANTRTFQALTAGFDAQIANLLQDNAALRQELHDEKAARERTDSRVTKLERREIEYLDHIGLLERMIPTPPGPPRRPWEARHRDESEAA